MNKIKEDIAALKLSANSYFFRVAVLLLVSIVLQTIGQLFSATALVLISLLAALGCSVCAYVFAFKGFGRVKKVNALEDTEYPNTGRNFRRFTIAVLVLYVLLAIVLLYVSIASSVLKASLDDGDATVATAYQNSVYAYAVVYSLLTVFSLNSVIALYVMRIHSMEYVSKGFNNLTLFCGLFAIVAIVINILATLYYYIGSADSTSLLLLSSIFRFASYIVMCVFFSLRGKVIKGELPKAETVPSAAPQTDEKK